MTLFAVSAEGAADAAGGSAGETAGGGHVQSELQRGARSGPTAPAHLSLSLIYKLFELLVNKLCVCVCACAGAVSAAAGVCQAAGGAGAAAAAGRRAAAGLLRHIRHIQYQSLEPRLNRLCLFSGSTGSVGAAAEAGGCSEFCCSVPGWF